MQRWVQWVFFPQIKILSGKLLHFFWKRCLLLLKIPQSPGFYGHGSPSPRAYASSASLAKKSSRPAFASSSICLSQASSSSSDRIAASARFSSNESVGSTSVLISSSVIIPAPYPCPPHLQTQKNGDFTMTGTADCIRRTRKAHPANQAHSHPAVTKTPALTAARLNAASSVSSFAFLRMASSR